MADALVSIVLKKMGSPILDGLEQEVRLVAGGAKKEIKRLTKTLTIIKGVLEDADEKQVKNEAVKLWLEEFKDISYDADDILDEWRTRFRISQMEQSDPLIKKKVQSKLFNLFSCSCFKHVVIRHEIGINIKELNKRLVGVNENIQTYGLKEIRSNEQYRPISSDLVVVEEIYGRDVDKDLILKLLDEGPHHDSHVPVISIVGTGGFGKTTLAQLILEQTKQLSKFKSYKHMWVCVSDPFNLEKVAKEIIEQAEGKVPDIVGWPMLHKSLYESVREKQFILVLDDVWSHNGNEWRLLKQALDGGAKGSRILITTRNERVAKMVDSSYTHLLGQLSNDDCWSLFKHIAFARREDDLNKFEDIGKAISKKCNGVPLAVRVMASLMCFKRTRPEWRAVLASNIWEVQEGEEGFLPSILLSYNALPSYLKPCLLYCAVLPKDSILKKKEMVKLWMAQGYLGFDGSGSTDLEMIGRDYFDNLAMLSFFQDFEKDDEGNIYGCKMHDFVHDVVQFLTKHETIILGEQKVISVKVRHLCAEDLGWSSVYQQKNLRTLRIHPKKNNTLTLELLHQLTCLRALSLRNCGIQKLPSEVEKLLHLRYLDLSYNDKLVELPKTVCNLFNLQTLNLDSCSRLRRLPASIAKLSSSLRNLHINECFNLKYMPVGVGKLRLLRTLEEFIVGGCDEETEEKGCTIGELRLLNHLEGFLSISGLGEVNGAQAELKMKVKLLSLKLLFRLRREDEVDGILESLQPHTNLEKFEIKLYQGIRLPDWILSLSNLTKLALIDLFECLELPALGKLPSLEVLELNGLISVKHLGCEFFGLHETHVICHSSWSEQVVIFPKLKKLTLSAMDELEKWDLPHQNRVDLFPNLQTLKLCYLKKLRVLQGLGKLKSLEILELYGADGLLSFHEFFLGSSMSDDKTGEEVVFPRLKYLSLYGMMFWEEKEVVLRKEKVEEGCNTNNSITIMPCLEELFINSCPELKVIPFYMFSHALKDLFIKDCKQLTGLQPSLPPLLQNLSLKRDVGVLTSSLLHFLHNNNENYPNLHYLEISDSSQSSLPQGFNLLTSIRQLEFSSCDILDFGPEDLKHLTMLKQLEINKCPILVERFRGRGEISSSSSHAYNINIHEEEDEDSSQLDVNVHIGYGCDNCEMNPIVGKRYKCKACYDETIGGLDLCEKCYNTPSKHTDLVNQHQRKGHTFELIANRGDSPVPVNPDDSSVDAEGGLVVAKSAEIEEQNKA